MKDIIAKRWKLKIGFILAVLIIALAILYIQDLGTVEQSYKESAIQNSSKYMADAEDRIRETCISPVILKEKPFCIQEAEHAARQNQRDEYALYSQRIMALWNAAMGKAAIAGIAVGFLSIWLIYTTFHETRRSNEIAKEQNRPWLKVKFPETAILGKQSEDSNYEAVRVAVEVENCGTGTAIRPWLVPMLIDCRHAFNTGEVIEKVVSGVAKKRFVEAPIFPGQKTEMGGGLYIQPARDPNTWERVKSIGFEDIYLALVVVYSAAGSDKVYHTGDIFYVTKQRKLKDRRLKVKLRQLSSAAEAT